MTNYRAILSNVKKRRHKTAWGSSIAQSACVNEACRKMWCQKWLWSDFLWGVFCSLMSVSIHYRWVLSEGLVLVFYVERNILFVSELKVHQGLRQLSIGYSFDRNDDFNKNESVWITYFYFHQKWCLKTNITRNIDEFVINQTAMH